MRRFTQFGQHHRNGGLQWQQWDLNPSSDFGNFLLGAAGKAADPAAGYQTTLCTSYLGPIRKHSWKGASNING